jgi:outer membrane biogenesis lipoprotein LolB
VEASEALKYWRYSAKASIKTAATNDQFNLDWRYNEGNHTIRLFGPLGVGAVRLEFDDDGANLSDKDGVLYSGPNAATLLREITGLNLPIDALQYWLFALPAPNAIAHYRLSLEGQQEIDHLKQLGWETQFSDYQVWSVDSSSVGAAVLESEVDAMVFANTRLPRRISSQGRGLRGEYIDIKIVTKLWDFVQIEMQQDNQ